MAANVVATSADLSGRRSGPVSARTTGLVAVAVLAATFIAFMVRTVPVDAPRLARSDAVRHWPAAATAALVVLAFVGAVTVFVGLRRDRQAVVPTVTGAATGMRMPTALRWQLVPRRVVVVGAVVSFVLASGALLSGYPLWTAGLGALVAWLPLLALEGASKYQRYGLFAVFFGVVVFQTLHMGEHSVQVLQMLRTEGDLAHSHGVFGQLDFETVHFVADTVVWMTLGSFLVVFRGRNRWLWVAFFAASLHQVEHFYLFWMYLAHPTTYASGGFAGIMGSGGVIGSPLGRPYLHFSYNVIVIVPMLVALWDQACAQDAESASVTSSSATPST